MSDEVINPIIAVVAQLEDLPQPRRIQVLQTVLAAELTFMYPEDMVRELIKMRFALMRINGILQSEGRPSAWLEGAVDLIDRDLLHRAPEAE